MEQAGEMGQPDKAVAYVQDASIKHIEEAINLADWESDKLVIDGWLGDCLHDMITTPPPTCSGWSESRS